MRACIPPGLHMTCIQQGQICKYKYVVQYKPHPAKRIVARFATAIFYQPLNLFDQKCILQQYVDNYLKVHTRPQCNHCDATPGNFKSLSLNNKYRNRRLDGLKCQKHSLVNKWKLLTRLEILNTQPMYNLMTKFFLLFCKYTYIFSILLYN